MSLQFSFNETNRYMAPHKYWMGLVKIDILFGVLTNRTRKDARVYFSFTAEYNFFVSYCLVSHTVLMDNALTTN